MTYSQRAWFRRDYAETEGEKTVTCPAEGVVEYSVDLLAVHRNSLPKESPATLADCFREPCSNFACCLGVPLATLATPALSEAPRIAKLASKWWHAFL